MAENENAQLRKEINRLNQLLDIVLLRNTQVENQLQYYVSAFAEMETLLSSYPELMDKAKKPSQYIPSEMDLANSSFPYMPSQMDTANSCFRYIPEDETIAKPSFYANPNDEPGAATQNPPILPQKAEPKQVLTTIQSADTAIHTASNTMPADAARAEKYRSQILLREIEKITPTAKLSGIKNAALILLRLHQSPRQSMKDLQKLTGLTEDGVIKRIGAMKKQGLIVRMAGRQLALTEKAKTILALAGKE